MSHRLIEGTRDTAKRSFYWWLVFDPASFGFSFIVYFGKRGQSLEAHFLWLDLYLSSSTSTKGKP